MIRRIVKMTFQADKQEAFLQMFREVKPKIEAFPGCHSVTLFRDQENSNTMFTWSLWDSDEDLQTYRQSPLFQNTWKKTKSYFSGKAEAWSLILVDE